MLSLACYVPSACAKGLLGGHEKVKAALLWDLSASRACQVIVDCSTSSTVASKYPEWLKAGFHARALAVTFLHVQTGKWLFSTGWGKTWFKHHLYKGRIIITSGLNMFKPIGGKAELAAPDTAIEAQHMHRCALTFLRAHCLPVAHSSTQGKPGLYRDCGTLRRTWREGAQSRNEQNPVQWRSHSTSQHGTLARIASMSQSLVNLCSN